MKEFINKIKKIDKTKKIVILFITISFVFIGGFSIYNGVTGNYRDNSVVQVSSTKDKKEKNTKEKKKEKQSEEINQTEEKKATSQKEETSSQETNKQESSEEKKEATNTEKKSANTTVQSSSKNSNVNHPQSSTSNSQTNSGQTSNNQSQNSSSNTNQQPNTEKINVSIQVIGVDSIMMSGNLSLDKETSAYSALKILSSQKGISVSTSGFGSSIYVRGIGGLYEFDYGGNSGWMYKVNNVLPRYGANSYKLKNGDELVWYYTQDYKK